MQKLDFKTATYNSIVYERDNLLSKDENFGLNKDELQYLKELKEEIEILDKCIIAIEQSNNYDSKKGIDSKELRYYRFNNYKPIIDKSIQAPKTILKRKVWTIEILEYSDGSNQMNRTNDGFNINELMGIASFVQQELCKHWTGEIEPDVVKRTVIID